MKRDTASFKAFRTNVALLLEARGLSQSELGRRCDIHASTVNQYLKGTREPGLPAIEAIARVLRVAPHELINTKFNVAEPVAS